MLALPCMHGRERHASIFMTGDAVRASPITRGRTTGHRIGQQGQGAKTTTRWYRLPGACTRLVSIGTHRLRGSDSINYGMLCMLVVHCTHVVPVSNGARHDTHTSMYCPTHMACDLLTALCILNSYQQKCQLKERETPVLMRLIRQTLRLLGAQMLSVMSARTRA